MRDDPRCRPACRVRAYGACSSLPGNGSLKDRQHRRKDAPLLRAPTAATPDGYAFGNKLRTRSMVSASAGGLSLR
jgi:hypothetical protein